MKTRKERLRTLLGRLNQQERAAGTRAANAVAALDIALAYADAVAVAPPGVEVPGKPVRPIEAYRDEVAAATDKLRALRREIGRIAHEVDTLDELPDGATIRVTDDDGTTRLYVRHDPGHLPRSLEDTGSGRLIPDGEDDPSIWADGVWYASTDHVPMPLDEVLGQDGSRETGFEYERMLGSSEVDALIYEAVQRVRDDMTGDIRSTLARAVWNLNY